MNVRGGMVAAAAAGLAFFLVGLPAACSSSPAPAPTVGGTGAFGIVTVNGKQKLYLPVLETNDGGNGQLMVVDVGLAGKGVAGVPAQVTTIDLGTTDLATCTAGDPSVVLAAGTATHNLWVINPATDKLTKTIALDPALNGSSFSGGGGVVTGIALDSANHRAILSLWNGFAYFDLNSLTITGSVLAGPAENFGFDATRQLLVAPFYDCTDTSSSGLGDAGPPPPCASYQALDGGGTITDGLNVINLTTNKVYTYENPAAADPTAPLGTEPDSAAVDTSSGLAVIPSEGNDTENVLDLSHATFNDATGTFTAPLFQISSLGDTGVAVESGSHLAFFEEEHNDRIGLIDLTKVATTTPPSAVIAAQMPLLPDSGNTWANLGDPHGIAVTTGILNGAPVGFVVTDDGSGTSTWVARIDLNKMQAIGAPLGAMLLEVDGGLIAPAVTFLDATTPE